jgi:hypothetical protein
VLNHSKQEYNGKLFENAFISISSKCRVGITVGIAYPYRQERSDRALLFSLLLCSRSQTTALKLAQSRHLQKDSLKKPLSNDTTGIKGIGLLVLLGGSIQRTSGFIYMSTAAESQEIKFGTDGWRGLIAKDFTFANVRKVTRAIAAYLETAYSKDRPVLVAYDPRFLADEFAQTAAEILVDLGWMVKIVDRDCPTPTIAYNALHLKSAGALMFTASHNPAPYCGIKYIPDYAGPATPEITDTIVANIPGASDAPPATKNPEKISTFDPKPEYLKFLYSQIDVDKLRSAKLKVKYDALYSTSRGYLDEVLAYCGCENGKFPYLAGCVVWGRNARTQTRTAKRVG